MTSSSRVLIGFDGFIDTLLFCVEKRFGPRSLKRLSTIPLFSKKILEASSRSTNIECVVKEQCIGGNAPLLARALVSLGHGATLVGTCGIPTLHPLFSPLQTKELTIFSFADPGRTDALEFTDGKLLLGKMGELHSLTLDDLMSRLGTTLLPTLIQQAEMIVTVNWTMMPLVGEFWRYLLQNTQFFTQGPRKSLFVDLADPAKRSVADLKKNLNSLSKLSTYCNVILSLNRSESDQVLQALCLSSTPSIQKNAEKIAVALGISSVVIHTHHDVACALLSKESIISESLRVSVVKNPVRSTGAGDTFNAGFLAGILRHQSPFVCLKAGVAASRVLVRTGITPTSDQVFN